MVVLELCWFSFQGNQPKSGATSRSRSLKELRKRSVGRMEPNQGTYMIDDIDGFGFVATRKLIVLESATGYNFYVVDSFTWQIDPLLI